MPDTANELQKIDAQISGLEGQRSELDGRIAALRRRRTAMLQAWAKAVSAEQDSLLLAHTKARRQAREERAISALKMRLEGKTFRQIGDAFGRSGTTARYLVFRGDKLLRKKPVDEISAQKPVPPSVSTDDPIDYESLLPRTRNCLSTNGILTYRDLLALGKAELLKKRNFGRMSLRDVTEHLEERNLPLPG